MAFDAGNIIVGAAQIYLAPVSTALPVPADESYATTLEDDVNWTSVGYTSNGLELAFAPEFGEVQVDQVLDVAKLFKSGMTVTMNTSFAETTLENLAIVLADSTGVVADAVVKDKDEATAGTDKWEGVAASTAQAVNVSAGQLGDCPVEKALAAVGPGPGECGATEVSERVYTAFRVLSIENVTISAKRDEASMFDVSFRLLPDGNGYYGQIVDRVYTKA